MSDYKVEKIEYRNHTIEIYRDEDVQHRNPMEDYDHSSCVEICHDSSSILYDQSDKVEVRDDIIKAPTFTEQQVRDNWKEIISAVDADCDTLLLFFDIHGIYGRHTYDNATDMFNEIVYELVEGLSTSDRYDALETMYNLLPEYAAVTGTGTGYVQSDWHQYIAIIELQKYVGKGNAIEADTKEKATDYIEGVMETYTLWVYGDVYGYVIYEGIDNAELELTKSEDEMEACWGFICEYQEDGYNCMIQTAKIEIDASIKQLELELEEETA